MNDKLRLPNPDALRRFVFIALMILLSTVGLTITGGIFADRAQTASPSSSFTRGSFTNDYGTRDYKLYVPSGYQGQRVPLIVMLHGCTQNADDFAVGTKMNAIAERETFLVLYPEQPSTANSSKCWNWYEPANQERGKGEPSIIAGATKEVVASHRVAADRVYVAGMSAGGAMSDIVGAAYPDLYAAAGIHSGLEYKAASDLATALVAMETGGPDPDRQGHLAFLSAGAAARVLPTIVFHGDLDTTVNVANGNQALSQWAQTNDYADDGADDDSITDGPADVAQGQETGGYAYTTSVYSDQKGEPLMERWIVHGMRHAWSGGSAEGSYTDPKGPDASEEMIRFFELHPKR